MLGVVALQQQPIGVSFDNHHFANPLSGPASKTGDVLKFAQLLRPLEAEYLSNQTTKRQRQVGVRCTVRRRVLCICARSPTCIGNAVNYDARMRNSSGINIAAVPDRIGRVFGARAGDLLPGHCFPQLRRAGTRSNSLARPNAGLATQCALRQIAKA